MNIQLYRRFLNQYVKEALDQGGGNTMDALSYLREKQIKGFLIRHKEEKQKALVDARQAFEEHRHWPLDIILSHLGVDLTEVENS